LEMEPLPCFGKTDDCMDSVWRTLCHDYLLLFPSEELTNALYKVFVATNGFWTSEERSW
jgi:hypothetical protein